MLYTEEELVDEVKRVSKEHCGGEAPKQEDIVEHSEVSYPTFIRRFEFWNDVLEKAGFERNSKFDVSKKNLIDEIKRVYNEYGDGGSLTANQMREHGEFSIPAYYNHFDSWNSALEKVNLNAGGQRRYSTDYLLNIIEDVEQQIPDNEIINITHINEYTKHSSSLYYNRFGSFYDALKRSSIVVEKHIQEALLFEIKRLEKELGRVPTQEDMTEHGSFGVNTYYRKIGSYNKALEKAGFEPNQNSYTKDEVFSEIERLSEEFFDGDSPTQSCFIENAEMSLGCIFSKFENWNNALEEAGFGRNGDGYNASSGEEHPKWVEGYDEYYGDSWYFKRKECLKRDGGECRLCGKDYTDEDYFSNPDVHHIEPVSEWDVEEEHEEMNDLNNLVCLCKSCHRPLEGKWQDASPEEFVENARDYLDIEVEDRERSVFDC